jgi:hypothetical protein
MATTRVASYPDVKKGTLVRLFLLAETKMCLLRAMNS